MPPQSAKRDGWEGNFRSCIQPPRAFLCYRAPSRPPFPELIERMNHPMDDAEKRLAYLYALAFVGALTLTLYVFAFSN